MKTGGDVVLARAVQRPGRLVVGDDDHDLRVDRAGFACVDDRLQVGAGSGSQNAQTDGHR